MGFMLPVLLALLLQSLYGAADLLICGHFATPADVSGVSTGSQIFFTMANLVTSFSMGLTVLLGQLIGMGRRDKTSESVGSGVLLFLLMGVVLTAIFLAVPGPIAVLMKAPEEAMEPTVAYLRICGGGSIVVVLYNLLGSIFRGIGDSKTPLMSVAIACVFNVAGDLLLVGGFGMGAAGAAIATVAAQLLSVVISVLIIRKKPLPFQLTRDVLKLRWNVVKRIFTIGFPIALQDFLVGLSFLFIMAIINAFGVTASAGVGVAEKVCGFLMLVPSAFMQSISAFVAQNMGAGKPERAVRTLWYSVGVSVCFGFVMFVLAFFHGDMLAAIFTSDAAVIAAAADYLKAYAIDCLLTCFLFCFVGFFNGIEKTRFVLVQGITSAFGVRIPVAYAMSRIQPVSLFHIGLGIPFTTVLQIIMSLVYYRVQMKKGVLRKTGAAAG